MEEKEEDEEWPVLSSKQGPNHEGGKYRGFKKPSLIVIHATTLAQMMFLIEHGRTLRFALQSFDP